MASAVTYFVLRTGLGAICLLAGLEKARAPKEFAEGVRQYRLVPSRFAPVVGGALIATELVLGLLLVTGLVPVLEHFPNPRVELRRRAPRARRAHAPIPGAPPNRNSLPA